MMGGLLSSIEARSIVSTGRRGRVVGGRVELEGGRVELDGGRVELEGCSVEGARGVSVPSMSTVSTGREGITCSVIRTEEAGESGGDGLGSISTSVLPSRMSVQQLLSSSLEVTAELEASC